MKSTRLAVTDPDLAGALSALKRAAAAAWRLSVETGTPFFVIDNGRVVIETPGRRAAAQRSPAGTGEPASVADSVAGPAHHL
jgi:hypothetical protein